MSKLEEYKIRRDLASIKRGDTRHEKYVKRSEERIKEYDLMAKQSKTESLAKSMKVLSSKARGALNDYKKTISSLNKEQDVADYRKQLKDIRKQ